MYNTAPATKTGPRCPLCDEELDDNTHLAIRKDVMRDVFGKWLPTLIHQRCNTKDIETGVLWMYVHLPVDKWPKYH